MRSNIKLATLNVRGLKNQRKRLSIFEWVKKNRIDIMLLQETYCTNKDKASFLQHWDGEIFHSTSDSSHSRGVAILISRNMKMNKDFKVIDVKSDKEGRRIILNISLNNEAYTIINMYCPNDRKLRMKFIENSYICIKQTCKENSNIIIAGDFNCTTEIIDKFNKQFTNHTYFDNFMGKLDIIDVWRIQHPDKVEFTYIDPSNRGYSSRIDKILVSKPLSKFVANSVITQAPCPDHKAVVVEIRQNSHTRGKGYWKLNSSVLNDKEYQEIITKLITETKAEYEHVLSKCELWQFLKARIKECSINYCIKKARDKKDEINRLEKELDKIDEQIAKFPNEINETTETRKIYKQARNELYMLKQL